MNINERLLEDSITLHEKVNGEFKTRNRFPGYTTKLESFSASSSPKYWS